MEQDRKLWIDLLNIAARMGVVLLHPLAIMVSGKVGLPFGNPYFGFVLTYAMCAAAVWMAKKRFPWSVRACRKGTRRRKKLTLSLTA